MKENTKDKIVQSMIWILACTGIILFVGTLLVFALKVGILFFLLAIGIFLLSVAYVIAKIYFDDVEL